MITSMIRRLQRVRMLNRRLYSHAPAADGVTPDSVIEFIVSQWPEHPSVRDVKCHAISSRHVLLSTPMRTEDIRPGGFISGPTQFSQADVAPMMIVSPVGAMLAPCWLHLSIFSVPRASLSLIFSLS